MEPSITVFVIDGPIDRADVPGLCERLRELLEGVGPDRVVCDVGAVTGPDAATVDALARMQLTARRLGRQMRLSQASCELQELLALMGLRGVLPLSAPLWVKPRRQAEEREKRRGIQEEADPGDPAI